MQYIVTISKIQYNRQVNVPNSVPSTWLRPHSTDINLPSVSPTLKHRLIAPVFWSVGSGPRCLWFDRLTVSLQAPRAGSRASCFLYDAVVDSDTTVQVRASCKKATQLTCDAISEQSQQTLSLSNEWQLHEHNITVNTASSTNGQMNQSHCRLPYAGNTTQTSEQTNNSHNNQLLIQRSERSICCLPARTCRRLLCACVVGLIA